MKWIILITTTMISLMVLEMHGAAQDVAPYSTGKLIVKWTRGAPPESARADRINMKCGPSPGNYTYPVKTIMLPAVPASPPEYPINIRDVIPVAPVDPTKYYCLPVSAMGTIESDKIAAEYSFTVTGEAIAAATILRLVP
jgi:hypothetical protein